MQPRLSASTRRRQQADIDVMSISAHKDVRSKGVGALYAAARIRECRFQRLSMVRSRTRQCAPARSTSLALSDWARHARSPRRNAQESCKLAGLRNRLRDRIMGRLDGHLNGSGEHRLPGIEYQFCLRRRRSLLMESMHSSFQRIGMHFRDAGAILCIKSVGQETTWLTARSLRTGPL